MTVQQLAKEIDGVRCDRMETGDAPLETQEAMAAAAEVWLELVDDSDLGT